MTSEKELLLKIAQSDEPAFALLMDRYWNNIFSQALAYLKSRDSAQDIVQEVFLKVWQKRQSLPSIERFDAFLFIIARNQIISELRKKLAQPINDTLLESRHETSPTPDETLELKGLEERMAQSIDRLPAQQRTAFLLSRREGLTYEEIASQMNLSKETVKKHIVRALNFLRTQTGRNTEMMLLFVTTLFFKKN